MDLIYIAPNIHWVLPPPPSDRHLRLCTPTRAYTNPLAASHRKKEVVILAVVAAFVGIAVSARTWGGMLNSRAYNTK